MQYKTIKEIAKECNVDKQKVYRFIKSNALHEVLLETPSKNNTKYYDEVVQKAVFEHFCSKEENEKGSTAETIQTTSYEVLLKHIELLEKQLEIKDNQIHELHLLLNATQQPKQIETVQEKTSFWKRIFSK